MVDTKTLAWEIADNYAWTYNIGDKYHIENGFGDAWEYGTAEELIADWYDTMVSSNVDYYKTGNKAYMIWSDEEVEFAKAIKTFMSVIDQLERCTDES